MDSGCQHGINNNNINKELEKAVKEENLEKVKALLSKGANANLRVERNRDTLLHTTHSVEITKELLLGGAEVNARNQYRETPLHYAISVEITKELLLGGAEVNARNQYRETPLHYAITQDKKLELVRELLKHGADVNATNRKGNTALNHAVKKCVINLGVVKELLEYGADINIRNREQRLYENCNTSLDNAVSMSLACAKLLIKFTLIRNFNKDYKKIIDLSPYKKCSNYSELSIYLDGCVCEIFQMKTEEIKDSLSLYEFVTNNFNIHLLYNNQLPVRLAKIDYSIRYPIYNDIILDKVKPFLERADLLNKLSKIQFYTRLSMTDQDVKEKKIILDHDSTYKITEYLSNDNLLNFIEAFDDFNKRASQSLSSLNDLVESDTRLYKTSISNDTKRARLE
ncbi:unnamed protein product [Euphydryas editha]|uniref:Ankyrin repeat protein n=1 Tax=Euphydryas editha TaxID=104508 RepID=A0AAU9U175_EUPED|nr:unnamed protein product [Euphydryas editha]